MLFWNSVNNTHCTGFVVSFYHSLTIAYCIQPDWFIPVLYQLKTSLAGLWARIPNRLCRYVYILCTMDHFLKRLLRHVCGEPKDSVLNLTALKCVVPSCPDGSRYRFSRVRSTACSIFLSVRVWQIYSFRWCPQRSCVRYAHLNYGRGENASGMLFACRSISLGVVVTVSGFVGLPVPGFPVGNWEKPENLGTGP